MKIKTKFIVSLVLLVLLPAIFTLFITNNFLSENLNFFHFFDTYYDIFDNFSTESEKFEDYITPYNQSPEYFLTPEFFSEATDLFATNFLIVEVAQNGTTVYISYSEELENMTLL